MKKPRRRQQTKQIRLDNASASMDALGAALAHELNQPLTALGIYLQSLHRHCDRQAQTSELIKELVAKALHESERMAEIIRKMRRFSARSEPERQLVDIQHLMEDSIQLARVDLAESITFVRDDRPGIPAMAVDQTQIRQVIVNLLRNAVEATVEVEEPRIVLSVKTVDGSLHIEVTDNGPGIAPPMANRLFQAFETSKINGLGLGLAISRMIAHAHGGDLVCKPQDKTHGACFVLILPIT